MDDKVSIFVSYAHADMRWFDELKRHLNGLERHAAVKCFTDTQLLGGDDWDARIKAELEAADIVLLVITANFIASEYIHQVELPAALKRRQDDGCVVMPVLFENCARRLLGIDDINYLPKDGSNNLKPFNKWSAEEQPDALTQVVEHLIVHIERKKESAARDCDTAKTTGIDLAAYRRRAQAKWSAIDLAALAAPGAMDADVTVRLADVFVPQLARRSRPAVSLPRDWLLAQGLDPDAEAKRQKGAAAEWERLTPVPALELVAQEEDRLLVLLGDPGAGKSALARYVLLQLLAEAPAGETPLAVMRGHVPVLIELRDFVAREAEGRCTDLLGYLAFCGTELGFGFDRAGLEQQLAERPSLLIVDGLDEIFDPKRRRLMAEQIIGLVGRYPRLRVLVTARIAGFDDHAFRAAEFAVATLVDLTPKQIARFVRDWFTVVFRGDEAAAARARDDLSEALTRRPQLRAIAGNPMILTIMATVARHKRLARSRAALYAQALDLLCYNWDYKRGLELPPDSPLIDLEPEDTLLMLRRVAWRMQGSPDGLRANAIAESDLRAVLEAFFAQDGRFDAPRAGRAAREMLARLEVRNWVLTVRGPALYGFVHRTFLEYLCALELIEQFRAQQIGIEAMIADYVLPRLDDDAWHEVLRLLIGSLPPSAAETVLLSMLPSDAEILEAPSRLGFAWQGLAEVEPRQIPTLRAICERLTDALYLWMAKGKDPEAKLTKEIADAALGIGPLSWPSLHPPTRPWPDRSEKLLHNYLYILSVLGNTVWNCSESVRVLVESVCSSGEYKWYRCSAFQVLASQFTDHPGTRTTLMLGAVEEEDRDCRRTAFRALADYFSADPATLPLLRARAIDDADGECRGTALWALAEHFPGDPATLPLLHSRALEDIDGGSRGTALWALAAHFPNDPATLPLLRVRAVDDADGECRGNALWALAEHFPSDPATLPLLRARAIDDADGECRGSALSALAALFSTDPATLPLLRARAIEDVDSGSRGSAFWALAAYFRADPAILPLLRSRALEDVDGGSRGAALSAIAAHFPNDPATLPFLRARAIEDIDETCRGSALLCLSHMLDVPHAPFLASMDFDGHNPGRDPLTPITAGDIAAAAERLDESPEAIRAFYEQLAQHVPLTFA